MDTAAVETPRPAPTSSAEPPAIAAAVDVDVVKSVTDLHRADQSTVVAVEMGIPTGPDFKVDLTTPVPPGPRKDALPKDGPVTHPQNQGEKKPFLYGPFGPKNQNGQGEDPGTGPGTQPGTEPGTTVIEQPGPETSNDVIDTHIRDSLTTPPVPPKGRPAYFIPLLTKNFRHFAKTLNQIIKGPGVTKSTDGSKTDLPLPTEHVARRLEPSDPKRTAAEIKALSLASLAAVRKKGTPRLDGTRQR